MPLRILPGTFASWCGLLDIDVLPPSACLELRHSQADDLPSSVLLQQSDVDCVTGSEGLFDLVLSCIMVYSLCSETKTKLLRNLDFLGSIDIF
jgi:hypothetical protein